MSSRPTESVFVSVDNLNEIIGFIEVLPTKQEGFGEIRSLFVCSAFWGCGIGTCLLKYAEEWLCAEGYHTGILWVWSENQIGRTFYEKAGWQKAGPAKDTDWPGLAGVKCCKLQKTLIDGNNQLRAKPISIG
jgi:GNAT superfamily N-acetyltransferase